MSSFVIFPLAIVASTGTPYNNPGKWKSEAYCAVPVTFNGPSTRGVSRPIGDAVSFLWHGMLGRLRREFQSVDEAALGQFDLEAVLALRLCAAQRCVGCFPESRFVGGLIG